MTQSTPVGEPDGGAAAAHQHSDEAGPPYRYERDAVAAELHERWSDLEPGTETETRVTIAGRLMLRRIQGKLAFGTLDDGTGRIQLFAPAAYTPDHAAFCDLNLGDWIGVSGIVMTTRRGELSVRVEQWDVLARARRPFPDKWHGMTDPDTRFRQRYVDLWVSPAARRTFALRSQMMSATRRFLEDRGYIEVETPIFHPIPGGALARPFTTHHNALDADLYLRIAPELYLKRLIVGGLDRVFEIGRVFRNEGLSTRHNPEFTMLELYAAYADYGDMMELTSSLVEHLAVTLTGTAVLSVGDRQIDVTRPWRQATMAELASEAVGRPISVHTPPGELAALAEAHDVAVPDGARTSSARLLTELYEKLAEPTLAGPIFVTEHPAETSPLARRHRGDPLLAERFEAVVAGRELANAFSELIDPDDQRQRFEAQAAARAEGDDEAMAVDEDYLRALEYGLPPTGGLGIGMDRLAMLLAGVEAIREVVLFPTLRPEQD